MCTVVKNTFAKERYLSDNLILTFRQRNAKESSKIPTLKSLTLNSNPLHTSLDFLRFLLQPYPPAEQTKSTATWKGNIHMTRQVTQVTLARRRTMPAL